MMVKAVHSQFMRNYLWGKVKILLSKLLVKLVLLYQVNWKEFPLVFNRTHNSKQPCNQHCIAP